ncbi:MAG: glycosyltransferase [Ignavibacteriae bacterium]|nr:glycosyltransferase [Ignavibacteriota bacterium]
MNILFVFSHEMKPNTGGVQRVTEALSNELIKRGSRVFYISLFAGENEVFNGIEQLTLPNKDNLDAHENTNFYCKILKQNSIEIIINQNGFSIKELNFIKKNNVLGSKIISVHHNCVQCLNDQYHNIYLPTLKSKGLDSFFNNKLGWYLLKKIHKFRFGKEIKKTIELSDRVVLLSNKFKIELSYYLSNFDDSKIVSISNPCPFTVHDLDFSQKQNRIIYVGTVKMEQKRVDRLIDIWSIVKNNFPDWEFDILGVGNYKKELERIVVQNDIDRVNFLGHQDPRTYLQRSKILLLVSDFEGFGMVLIEAQAYGVVPITFDCFAAAHDIVLHNESGIVVNNFDINEFASKLQTLMKDEIDLSNKSRKAYDHAKKFGIEQITDKWMNLFMTI